MPAKREGDRGSDPAASQEPEDGGGRCCEGSMHDFPFAEKTFRTGGLSYSVVADPGQLDREELILEERKAAAAQIKSQVEAWLNTIPVRMQRIIRYRDFEELTWRQVAMKMGRRATEESVKKEYQRFF